MNVCYLIDVHPSRMNGGGQIHLTNLVRELSASRLKRPGLPGPGPEGPGLSIFGGSSRSVLLRLVWMFFVVPQVLFHHFFIRRFDLIHAHSIPAMIPAKILSLLLGVPVIVTVHGHTMGIAQHPVIPRPSVMSSGLRLRSRSDSRRSNDLTWNLSRIMSGTSYRFLIKLGMTVKIVLEKIVLTKIRYDVQITVSRDFLKVPNINKNIVYIPNGIDLARFQRPGPGVRQGQALSDVPTILFVGRKNDPVKGFSILEEAMTLVRKQFPSACLLVADGTISPIRLPHLYYSANIMVIPSLSEGFPLTLLEAWASRVPVVATEVGEIPNLVKDGVNGFLVHSGDARLLADGILRALKHKDLAKIAKNGYNLAKRFTWHRVAKETIVVYTKNS